MGYIQRKHFSTIALKKNWNTNKCSHNSLILGSLLKKIIIDFLDFHLSATEFSCDSKTGNPFLFSCPSLNRRESTSDWSMTHSKSYFNFQLIHNGMYIKCIFALNFTRIFTQPRTPNWLIFDVNKFWSPG